MEEAAFEISVMRMVRAFRRDGFSRCFLIIVFAWSAGGKIFWPTEFKEELIRIAMIPPEFITPIQYGLPAIEILVAISLAINVAEAAGLTVVVFLSIGFAGVHLIALIWGIAVPCGCIGVRFITSARELHAGLLLLNTVMLAAAVDLLFHLGPARRPPSCQDNVPGKSSIQPDR